jgi:pyridoxine 5'-phosphate synthase PdxJ
MTPVETNPLLEEIRQIREEIARECGFNVRTMMDRLREYERELKARGVKFVSFAKPPAPK